jgi:hypothetical protein
MTNTVYLNSIDGNSVVNKRLSANFTPYGSTAMTVSIDVGHVWNGVTLTEVASQTSSAISAPVSNSRIDRLVIDQITGSMTVVTGTPAVSPTAPEIPTGKFPVAQVLVYSSATSLGNSTITDERDFNGLGGIPNLRLLNYATDTGSTNAFAVAPSPAISSYAVGQMVTLKPVNGQTGSATLAVNGLTATAIKTSAGVDPAAGMMSSNGVAVLMHNGTNFTLLNPIVNSDTIPMSTTTTNNVSSAARGFAPVGSGSSTQFLNGQGNYASVPASTATSQVILLSAQTASSVATLDFNVLTTDYDYYKFVINTIENTSTSATNKFQMRGSSDGVTYSTSVIYYTQRQTTVLSTPTVAPVYTGEAAGNAAILSTALIAGTAIAGYGWSGEVNLYNPLLTSTDFSPSQYFDGSISYSNTQNPIKYLGTMSIKKMQAVRFLMSSGNIASGSIECYGFKNS